MFTRSRPATVCARCLARRYLSTSSQPATALPPPPPPSGAAKLTNRRLLALSGHDAAHFLQGIVTQNIRPGLTSGLYSAFLNAQGRVLHDVFIYPTTHSQLSQGPSSSSQASPLPSSSKNSVDSDPSYLIEVDAAEASRLLSHIKKYKLRAKLTARLVDEAEWNVWSVWDAAEKWTPHSSLPLPASASSSTHSHAHDAPTTIGCVDPRAPRLGRRLVLPDSQTPLSSRHPAHSSSSPDDAHPHRPEITTLASYTLRRILHGVPEGQSEIHHATALPLECNLDYMGGVDFRKGCYVGQELTIRTRHTGVVRKRVLPVRLYGVEEEGTGEVGLEYDEGWEGGGPGSGANIVRVGVEGRGSGRSAGKWVVGVGNVGLALCRLEVMVGEGGGGGGEFKVVREEGEGEVRVKAFVPSWHRNQGGVVDVLHRERST